MDVAVWQAGSIVLGSVLASFFVFSILMRRRHPNPQSFGAVPVAAPISSIILRNGFVADISEETAKSLGLDLDQSIAWSDLHRVFHQRFTDFPDHPPKEALALSAVEPEDDDQLVITPHVETMRLELVGRLPSLADKHNYLRSAEKAEMLSAAVDLTPSPVWRLSTEGRIIWANHAYWELVKTVGHEPADAPLAGTEHVDESDQHPLRLSKTLEDGTDLWLEVTAISIGTDKLCFANDIAALVHAEIAQRNFVQTLAKTFAHLPIGLAIFDRKRQLALFNPALVDLTALSAEFLSARPNMFAFFDHLREARMMPEPKNYGHWRNDMADLVRAACDDRYCETWTLPSGLTYKVTGRPHPDGAIAFLIEDISAEISLTRRFRAELDRSQSALDTLDDAVAIFSQVGLLTICNASYQKMWDCDPDSGFNDMSVLDASRMWQVSCKPNPIWAEIRDFVIAESDRAEWCAKVVHKVFGEMRCHVSPLKGGSTLIRFEPALAWHLERGEEGQKTMEIAH